MREKTGRLILMVSATLMAAGVLLSIHACREPYSPKPRSFFRIDLPKKEYRVFTSPCKYSFEYPAYGMVNKVDLASAEPCWYNIDFKDFQATIYLTYKPVDDNLASHIEDIHKIVYKHIIKADDILETRINRPEEHIYGLIYDIQGNAASSVNFYITDSLTGFLSGALYFNVQTNKDSLAPVIQFFREDIVHLVNTISWE